MGNNVSSGGLCSNSGGTVQLGRYASINLSEREIIERDNDGSFKERWTISYNVHGLQSSWLRLTKRVGKDGKVNWLQLGISEFYFARGNYFLIPIRRMEDDFFDVQIGQSNTATRLRKVKGTDHGRGGVTVTYIYTYGNGDMGGLLVVECKNKSEDGMSYALNVAHYYANSSGNIFSKTDIGLSVVARIRASRGNLDITVDGPLSHPASALFYMFDHVFKTGIWKPTACPHCADNVRKQIKTLLQSNESEDSDSVPFEPRHETRRHVANHGVFVGDGNGNFIERIRNYNVFRI